MYGDGLSLVLELWQLLVEFFSDERHHGMQQSQPCFDTLEQRMAGLRFQLFVGSGAHWLCRFDVDIAQFIQPEVVEDLSCLPKFVAAIG